MQFLDAIGLAYFWKKIKNWVNINYLSLTGGTIRGSVSFLREGDGGSSITISPLNITKSGCGDNYLFASGKMIPIGEANGVAGLDANGNVPLAQLGNLDTTVAEVVTALPTTNIKKHIYLIEDEDGDTQNQYKEYIYTGDTSATYDASKWEKLGDFRATVDLADYAKKSETVNFREIKVVENILSNTPQGQITRQAIRFSNLNNENIIDVEIKDATSNMAGLLSIRDKNKLDMFDVSNIADPDINVGKLVTSSSVAEVTRTSLEMSIALITLDGNSLVFKLPQVDAVNAGVMSGADKTKLNGIASGATADSAITTAEIDALFA